MRHPNAVNLLIAAVLSSTLTLFTGMLGVTGVSAQPGNPGGSNERPRRSYSRLDRRGD